MKRHTLYVVRLRPHDLLGWLVKGFLALAALTLIAVGIAIGAVETGWGKNWLRGLIVRQANRYLTAQLEIGRLQGTLFSGIQLGDIRVSRDGRTLISIDDVSVSYSIRELVQSGIVIRNLTLIRPQITASRLPDGRWDLGSLIKREARQQERRGPGRPIEISALEMRDAEITLSDEVRFGAARIPTRYRQLNAKVAFVYQPVQWRVTLEHVNWRGTEPELDMNRLAGAVEYGSSGVVLENLSIATPRSAFVVSGRVGRGQSPAVLDLQVKADRFAFQEWSGVLSGLRNLAVDGRFDATLRGPLNRLDTRIDLQSDAGDARGSIVLDTRTPGWTGVGTFDVARIDLAKWLSKPDKPSDITGRVAFDLVFGFGRHFPRGTYDFAGRHAMFMGYAGDEVHARGTLTADAAVIDAATARAYGANVTITAGSIGIQTPFPFRFAGHVAGIDLRRLPAPIPVPHVESMLSFDYDTEGRFSEPFLRGRARFEPSAFLDASLGDGLVGTIDTSVKPLTFSGDGEISNVNMTRFGKGLDVGWMRDPRYAGVVSGRFTIEGAGSDRQSLVLTGGGRVRQADIFGGRLEEADVQIGIERGSLSTSFNGRFSSLDPARSLDDARFAGLLNGEANITLAIQDLLERSPGASDVVLEGTVGLMGSTVRGLELQSARIDATYRDGQTQVRDFQAVGPAIDVRASGTVGMPAALANACVGDEPCSNGSCLAGGENCPTDLSYAIGRADLAQLQPLIGLNAEGLLSASGHLSGSLSNPRIAGDGTVARLKAPGVEALNASATYDVTLSRPGGLTAARGTVTAQGTFVELFGRNVPEAEATVTVENGRVSFDATLESTATPSAGASGVMTVHEGNRAIELESLTLTLGEVPWRLVPATPRATVTWDDGGIAVLPGVTFAGASPDERIEVAGTWRHDGGGELRVTASKVVLDTLSGAAQPARYGGRLDLDATIRGTRDLPIVTGQVLVTDGRVRRLSYEKLAGRVDYANRSLTVDLTLDQSPGVGITIAGTVPMRLFDPGLPDGRLDVAVKSTPIDLGLIEGLTDVVRNVTGYAWFDVRAEGTGDEPYFEGTINVADAGFQVADTGVRYENSHAALRLERDRLDVDTVYVEDNEGRALELFGSLGTRALRVDDLAIDVRAKGFEVVRNEFGTVNIDATLMLRGSVQSPVVVGDLGIAGGSINVDRILEQALFRPYATVPIGLPQVDAVAVLNPWDRLGLNLSLHVSEVLRMVGRDVQVSQGTPIGLGDINMRTAGDLYFYKEPGVPLSLTGSLYTIRGTYTFQGKPFTIDETASSVVFPGDVHPEVYIAVTRDISGVQARVSLLGDLRNPELQLSSTPPLDQSDILSLIIFNTTTNSLSPLEQEELAVRAATLAAGFLAQPIVSAIERSLGLDILQIEPSNDLGGPRVTVGEQIAPGLTARFSRQFGPEESNEVAIEYYLSRLFRLRATFSDAQALAIRSPFRRVERAGLDLLFFFSF